SMINKNRIFPRLPIKFSAIVPMDCPLLRTDKANVPKSCTPAASTVPRMTHKNAGPQHQYTAMAGPKIGAAPATEEKWCHHNTNLFVGTKSTPSLYLCAGVT